MKAPPLGVMPKTIWQEKIRGERITALLEAMYRYSSSDKSIPLEWVLELWELLEGSNHE